MFKLFKRWGAAPPPAAAATPSPAPAREPAPAARPRPTAAKPQGAPPVDALPVPEVVAEGNEPTDWSLWEDSVNALDSQMQNIMPSARVYEREAPPSQLDDVDAFARVGKNRDM